MIEKITMHETLLDAFKNVINENNLPVHIEEGDSYKDFNGDLQIDILMEYQNNDATLINQFLNDTINVTFGLI